MLSRRSNEIQNARKDKNIFGVLKTFQGRKKKIVYLMET